VIFPLWTMPRVTRVTTRKPREEVSVTTMFPPPTYRVAEVLAGGALHVLAEHLTETQWMAWRPDDERIWHIVRMLEEPASYPGPAD
jgi:hypothetical protein